MAKHTVTVVALIGLLAAGGVAYYLNQRPTPAADVAAGRAEAPKSAADRSGWWN
jgi:hypothetical protein